MTPAIEVHDLAKRYGERTVLGPVSLEIPRGVFALLGPNGAGKTTLVSILTTLTRPTQGTARILGHDVVTDAAQVRRLVAATGQETSLDGKLTGRENLVMAGRLRGLTRREAKARAEELLVSGQLTGAGERLVATYSGGMRRRIDLAASLVCPPAVLFLDEPTTGLDPTSRLRLWDEIRALAHAGATVFLTTQILDEAEALADRVAVLRDGRIVADGTPDDLKALVGGDVAVLLDAEGGIARTLETDGSAASIAAAVEALGDSEGALRLDIRRPTLEDAFAALTSAATDEPNEAESPNFAKESAA